MKALLNYLAVISAITIITTVLLQSRGSGLGGAFGGGNAGGGFRTRRGAEKTLYYATIGAAVVLVLSVLLSILAKR